MTSTSLADPRDFARDRKAAKSSPCNTRPLAHAGAVCLSVGYESIGWSDAALVGLLRSGVGMLDEDSLERGSGDVCLDELDGAG